MADTVTVPTVGPVKKPTLILVGTGVGGFILWRYVSATKKARATAESASSVLLDPLTGLPYDMQPAGTVGDNYNVPGGAPVTLAATPPPYTNEIWTRDSTAYLVTQDYAAAAVTQALGKFLTKTPLTSDETLIVRAAIAAYGQPPAGGPWTVLELPAPPVARQAPVTNLIVSQRESHALRLQWNIPDGAVRYHITEVSNQGASDKWVGGPNFRYEPLRADVDHRFEVFAINAAGNTSPGVTVYGRTLREGQAPS